MFLHRPFLGEQLRIELRRHLACTREALLLPRFEEVRMLREILLVWPLHLVRSDVDGALDERAEEGIFERGEIRVVRLVTSSTSRLRRRRAQRVERSARVRIDFGVPRIRVHHDELAGTARRRKRLAGAVQSGCTGAAGRHRNARRDRPQVLEAAGDHTEVIVGEGDRVHALHRERAVRGLEAERAAESRRSQCRSLRLRAERGGTMPAPTAAAEPLDEPPGVRARSSGLRVSFVSPPANAVVTVLPTTIAPPERSACTHAASHRGCQPL